MLALPNTSLLLYIGSAKPKPSDGAEVASLTQEPNEL
jgi:hypothetical protein